MSLKITGKFIAQTKFFKLIVAVDKEMGEKILQHFGDEKSGLGGRCVPLTISSDSGNAVIQLTMPKRLRDPRTMPNLIVGLTYIFLIHVQPWKYDGKSGYSLIMDGYDQA